MKNLKENIGTLFCGVLLGALVIIILMHKMGFFSFISW
jgi:hypothetical protein